MNRSIALILAGSCTLALTACAPFKPIDRHAGMCNQLNSDLIFNGSAPDMRSANIENAETPLIQRSYDKNCEGKNTSDAR